MTISKYELLWWTTESFFSGSEYMMWLDDFETIHTDSQIDWNIKFLQLLIHAIKLVSFSALTLSKE